MNNCAYLYFRKSISLICSARNLSTTCRQYGQGRMMKKFINPSQKHKKFKYIESPVVSTTNAISSITNDSKKSVNTKRVSMLNKLFMRHISDLMSTSSGPFTGYGIEIIKIKVAPDFKKVQVYWLTRSDIITENIEELLKNEAGKLRHELSQLHVMGIVPKIEFVKDIGHTMLRILDDKLAQADFGTDHIPVDHTSKLKQDLELQINLVPNVRKQIESLDNDLEVEAEDHVDQIFEMPQNVLGLNHTDIMNRILKAKKKSQAPHRIPGAISNELPANTYDVNDNPVMYPSSRAQREAFRDFLNKRQLLRQKALKDDRDKYNQYADDYYEEEWQRRHEEKLKKYDFHEYLYDEKDFIDDEDNRK